MILATVGLIGAFALMTLLDSAAIAVEPVPLGPAFEVVRETSIEDPPGVTQPGFAKAPRISGDPDGNAIFSWRIDDNFTGGAVQKFGPDGQPLAPQFVVGERPSEYPGGEPYRYYTYRLDVDADEGGNFVIAWAEERYVEDETGKPVSARAFTTSGTPTGGEASVGYSTSYYVSTEVFDDGRFIVAWPEQDCEGGEDSCILAKRGAGKSVKSGTLHVNTNPVDDPFVTEVGIDGAENALVVWTEATDVFGRVIDLNLNPLSPEFMVSNPLEYSTWPEIVNLDSGFIVVWRAESGAHARVFDAAGIAQTDFAVGAAELYDLSATRVDAEHFVVAWMERNDVTSDREIRMQLYENDGTPEGSEFVLDTDAGGSLDDNYLAVGSRGEGRFTVAWDGNEYPAGCADPDRCGLVARLFALSEEPQQVLLPGAKLKISNVLPEDPERSKGQWTVKNTGIQGILPGGLSDPRCLFDPPGTTRAGIRFSGPATGHDTGPIGLPCQNWVKLGKTPTRSWMYFDRTLADGPCSKIILKDGKSIKATCKGKNGVASFPYDLEAGVAETQIDVVLRIGATSYCTSFPPSGSKNGSDGKTFLGKNTPPPGACASGDPIPPS